MKKSEYLLKALIKKYCLDYKWIEETFSILSPSKEYKYFITTDNEVYGLIDDEEILIEDFKLGESFFKEDENIKLNKGIFKIVKEDIETTFQKTLVNYMTLEIGLRGNGEFINREFDASEIENDIIAPVLKDNPKDGKYKDNEIYVDDLLKFNNIVRVLKTVSDFIVVSGTKKTITPATGIKEYKEQLIKEAKEKYGENALENYVVLAEIDEKLKKYDAEYLKDDPTNGITTTGKIKNIVRKKQFGMFGAEDTFVEKATADPVLNSLMEGLPKNKKELAALFNNSRFGSFMRGFATREAGVIAKVLATTTVGFNINDEDCGTNRGLKTLLTKNKFKIYKGYSVKIGSKWELIDNHKELIGKTVEIRLPMYCKLNGDNFCRECVGKNMFKKGKKAIPIAAMALGGRGLNEKMKAMHGKELKIMELNIDKLQDKGSL